MPSTYTLISSNVLSSSAASVTFSAIPSTYTDLVIRMSTRGNDSGAAYERIALEFNADASTIYSVTYLTGDGSSVGSSRSSSYAYINQIFTDGSTSTSNTFGTTEIYIPSYTASQNKPLSVVSFSEENTATGVFGRAIAGLYRSTAAISSIKFYPTYGTTIASGSSFYLYGIKNS